MPFTKWNNHHAPCSPVCLLLNILISLHLLCSNTAFYMAKCTNYLPFTLLSTPSICQTLQTAVQYEISTAIKLFFHSTVLLLTSKKRLYFLSFAVYVINVLHTQITYIITYLLIPWSRVLLEKLTGFAANQEIPRILWNP